MLYAILCYDREEVVGSWTPDQDRLQPSPVVSLNRAVAVAKLRGPTAALAMLDGLARDLCGYFYFFGVRGALLVDLGRVAAEFMELHREHWPEFEGESA